ncbi:MAG: DUF4129 domain-containing protein [Halobacteriaceae archaeon]
MDTRLPALGLLALVALAIAAGGVHYPGLGGSATSPVTPPADSPQTATGEPTTVDPGTGRPPAATGTPLFTGSLLLVVLLAVGVASALYWRRGADSLDADDLPRAVDDEDDEDATEESAARAVAAEAADRLEAGADFENEIYRAWWEMVRTLPVRDPDTATPGEFADAAVDAGLDPDAVATLTGLFQAVRYGDRDPEPRRAEAVAALRTVERGRDDGGSGAVRPDGHARGGDSDARGGTGDGRDDTGEAPAGEREPGPPSAAGAHEPPEDATTQAPADRANHGGSESDDGGSESDDGGHGPGDGGTDTRDDGGREP